MLIKSFVRRSRPLSHNKQLLLKELLPKLRVPIDSIESVMQEYGAVNLEIGFGNGEFLLSLSQQNQDLNIGCEPYIAGITSLLSKIQEKAINNLMIWDNDVRLFLPEIPNNSLSNIYILFPDPWPKRSQHKRRLINTPFVNLIYQKIKKDGQIFIATDHHEYADSILTHFKEHEYFFCNNISADNASFFENRSTTYYRKNLERREIRLYRVVRLGLY